MNRAGRRAAVLALLLAAFVGGPVRASQEFPDVAGFTVKRGTDPQMVGRCIVAMRGFFAVMLINHAEIDISFRQMNTAFEHAANEGDKAFQDGVLAGASVENDEFDQVLHGQGTAAAAQAMSDQVGRCEAFIE